MKLPRCKYTFVTVAFLVDKSCRHVEQQTAAFYIVIMPHSAFILQTYSSKS